MHRSTHDNPFCSVVFNVISPNQFPNANHSTPFNTIFSAVINTNDVWMTPNLHTNIVDINISELYIISEFWIMAPLPHVWNRQKSSAAFSSFCFLFVGGCFSFEFCEECDDRKSSCSVLVALLTSQGNRTECVFFHHWNTVFTRFVLLIWIIQLVSIETKESLFFIHDFFLFLNIPEESSKYPIKNHCIPFI